MKWAGNKTWSITASGKIVADLAIHKINHALGGSRLLHVALLPTCAFQLFLILHKAQGTLARNILRMHLHHHATIAPCRTAIGGRHSVDDNLLRTGSCRNDKASGTHAEGIDSAAVHLCDKGIFGSWQVMPTTILIVVLYLVDEFTRMFKAYTDSQPFSFNLNAGLVQIAIDIAGRMSSSKDDGTGICNE